MNFTAKDLKKLEKKVKDKRFSCQRTCGVECCTMLGVVVSPFSSISFIAGYFRALQILNTVSVFGVEPVLGQNSLLPLLWKKEGFPCIFLRIDGQPKCLVWEDMPISCITYPAGLYMEMEGKIKVVLSKEVICPETAFLDGEPLEKLARRAEEKFQKQAEFADLYLKKITPILPEYMEKHKKTVQEMAAERNKQLKEEDTLHILQKAIALELLGIAVNLHADKRLTPKALVDEYEKHINKGLKST
jgi:Fe-S-cluster containining protein